VLGAMRALSSPPFRIRQAVIGKSEGNDVVSYEKAAEVGFAKAREVYTGKDADKNSLNMKERFKSNNKLHLSASSSVLNSEFVSFTGGLADQDAAYSDRYNRAFKSMDSERIGFKVEGTGVIGSDVFNTGRVLRISKTQALNCHELACIAAESAYSELKRPKPAPIALAQLHPPADHVFCVIGGLVDLQNLNGCSIGDLENTVAYSEDIYAVDPWLNFFCHLRNYGTYAELKLKKWQQANKRVYWGAGSKGAGWYAPEGEYSQGFADATMLITPAS
jgi:hypothetical protein